MSPLQILHENIENKITIITVIGQLDESNVDTRAPEIYSIIDTIPEGGTLIFNFSGLEYMNSKSIGYLTDFFNRMSEKKGRLMVAESPPQITDVLTVVGVAQIVEMLSSLDEAKRRAGGEDTSIHSEENSFSSENTSHNITPNSEIIDEENNLNTSQSNQPRITFPAQQEDGVNENIPDNESSEYFSSNLSEKDKGIRKIDISQEIERHLKEKQNSENTQNEILDENNDDKNIEEPNNKIIFDQEKIEAQEISEENIKEEQLPDENETLIQKEIDEDSNEVSEQEEETEESDSEEEKATVEIVHDKEDDSQKFSLPVIVMIVAIAILILTIILK